MRVQTIGAGREPLLAGAYLDLQPLSHPMLAEHLTPLIADGEGIPATDTVISPVLRKARGKV